MFPVPTKPIDFCLNIFAVVRNEWAVDKLHERIVSFFCASKNRRTIVVFFPKK